MARVMGTYSTIMPLQLQGFFLIDYIASDSIHEIVKIDCD